MPAVSFIFFSSPTFKLSLETRCVARVHGHDEWGELDQVDFCICCFCLFSYSLPVSISLLSLLWIIVSESAHPGPWNNPLWQKQMVLYPRLCWIVRRSSRNRKMSGWEWNMKDGGTTLTSGNSIFVGAEKVRRTIKTFFNSYFGEETNDWSRQLVLVKGEGREDG